VKILETMKDVETRFLNIKGSPAYKNSASLKDYVDLLEVSLSSLKKFLQLK
jgi:hypothetical protein